MSRGVAGLLVVLVGVFAPALTAAQEGEELSAEEQAFLAGGEEGEPSEGEAEEGTDGEAAEGATAEGGETGDTGEAETPSDVDDEDAAFLAGEEEAPEIEAPEEERGIGWNEPADMRFWMVGARWRMIMVPEWLLDAFMDFPSGGIRPESVTVNQAAGLEFTTRKNRFSIIGGIWWAGYSTDTFIAEEAGQTGDPEYIRSDINLLMFTVDFVHSYMFTDWIGITYGAGLGLGVKVAGDLHRHEARPNDERTGYVRCASPGDGSDGLCENDQDGYYNETDDRVWPVYPWINLLIGIRFKVFRHLEINIDGGVGLGFLFGARVNYIF